MKLDTSPKATRRNKSILESMSQPDWVIKDWQIHFLLTEKQLHQVKKLSGQVNWYEDPVVIDTCYDRVRTCFKSIHDYYSSFGCLPQTGDRLFDEDSGLLVQDRSIDADLRVITFTLSP